MKVKCDKKTEVKRCVMCDRRHLGTLFVAFVDECQQQLPDCSSSVTIPDMCKRKYYPALESAVLKTTTTEKTSGIKSGLKISLYYLLKKLAKVIKSTLLVSGEDEQAAEMDKFVDVLTLNYNFLLGDAVYAIHKNRETRLQKPEAMLDDSDIELIRTHTWNAWRHC